MIERADEQIDFYNTSKQIVKELNLLYDKDKKGHTSTMIQTFFKWSRFSSLFEYNTIELKFFIFLACSCNTLSRSAWTFFSSSNSNAIRSLSNSDYKISFATSNQPSHSLKGNYLKTKDFRTCNKVFLKLRISSSKCSEWDA